MLIPIWSSNWQRMSKLLRRVALDTHGESLLDAFCETGNAKLTKEAVKEIVRTWLESHVIPDLKERQRDASGTEQGTILDEVLLCFAEEYTQHAISRRLHTDDAQEKLKRWCWQEPRAQQQAKSVLGNVLRQFLYDVRTEGQEHRKIQNKIDQAVKVLFQEAEQQAATDRGALLNRYKKDISFLAAALLAFFQRPAAERGHINLPDRSCNLETLIEHLGELRSEFIDIDDSENELAILGDHLDADIQERIVNQKHLHHCLNCKDCKHPLTPEERDAFMMKVDKLTTGDSDSAIAERYGISRGTVNRRLREQWPVAAEKLLNCTTEF